MLIGEWGSFKAIHRICKERTQTNTFIRIIYSPRGKRYLMVFYLLVIIFIIFIIDMYFPVMIQLVLVLPLSGDQVYRKIFPCISLHFKRIVSRKPKKFRDR